MVWVLAAVLAGCTPYVGDPARTPVSSAAGQFHRVSRGETLWSISRRYGVSLEDLTLANQISNASQIEVGQRLLIPPSVRSGSAGAESGPAFAPAGPRSSWASAGDSEEFIWPVEGKVVAIFGARRGGRINKGVDIQAPEGADVRAARAGRVAFVHEGLPGFGKTIILEHGDSFASVYAYVSQILVQSGEAVSQRQVIARVGSTGRTEVPALHFEIRRHQKPQNPLYYLP